jgi:hypothetical protein
VGKANGQAILRWEHAKFLIFSTRYRHHIICATGG